MVNSFPGETALALRAPLGLRGARSPGAVNLAILYALEAMARATLVTVIPLQALAILGDAQKVSLLFFVVSLSGLVGAFAVPGLMRRTSRRLIYGLGAGLLVFTPFLMATGTLSGLVSGMMIQVFAVVCLGICFNLYVMDHIPRPEFSRSEPLRMFYSAGAWMVGPVLGAWLGSEVSRWAPFALSAVFALALVAYIQWVRLSETRPRVRLGAPRRTPMVNLQRFFSQPRLVLSWLITMGRSAWWVMFFIYAPIYAVTSGLGEIAGGLMVSLGAGFLFLMPLWGRILRRFGLRRLYLAGFLAAGLATMGAGVAYGVAWLGAFLLVGAAFSMVSLDAAGNILFLRVVRPSERPEMTTVFGTSRDFAMMATPGVFSVLLRTFELSAVFLAGGLAMVGLAALSRRIPRRM